MENGGREEGTEREGHMRDTHTLGETGTERAEIGAKGSEHRVGERQKGRGRVAERQSGRGHTPLGART